LRWQGWKVKGSTVLCFCLIIFLFLKTLHLHAWSLSPELFLYLSRACGFDFTGPRGHLRLLPKSVNMTVFSPSLSRCGGSVSACICRRSHHIWRFCICKRARKLKQVKFCMYVFQFSVLSLVLFRLEQATWNTRTWSRWSRSCWAILATSSQIVTLTFRRTVRGKVRYPLVFLTLGFALRGGMSLGLWSHSSIARFHIQLRTDCAALFLARLLRCFLPR
jgi:hypothetical protein